MPEVAKNYEIRKITPPRLSKMHLGEKIIGYRPMRQGTPNMTVEYLEEKVIANNYGHGGSGWTLAPGAASYVNQLLEMAPFAEDLTKSTPITIVGAGALGLFSGYDLLQRGYKNITIIAEQFDNLTSHNAGGLLAPISMRNDDKSKKIVDRLGIDSYKFFKNIDSKHNSIFKNNVSTMPAYFENREDSGLEPFVAEVMQPAKDVILDFGNATARKMVAYDDGIFIHTKIMMSSLTDYLQPRIKFVQRKISTFTEVTDKYIINCTGMGAKELNKDNQMISVQGHLIMLKDQEPQNLNYMLLIYFDEGQTRAGQKLRRAFYIFPKKNLNASSQDIGVIGGTYVVGATNITPNIEEFETLLKNAKRFYGIS